MKKTRTVVIPAKKGLARDKKARFEAASANLQRMLREIGRFTRKPEVPPLREPEIWRADQATSLDEPTQDVVR